MTEITNPGPDDPSGASTLAQDSSLVDGSQSLLDGGSTGTDEGPAGIPAALVGQDKAGDPVDPPPAARSGTDVPDTGPASESDPLSPSDTASPLQVSPGRGDTASGGTSIPPSSRGDSAS